MTKFNVRRTNIAKIAKFIVFITTILFTLGGGCPQNHPSDENNYWDTDGDSISNAVETNDANSHLGFDPDEPNADPSIAHGSPNQGWLEGGINLPNTGTGYRHYLGTDPIDFDDWGTLALINTLEGTGRDWVDLYSSRLSAYGDMSLQDGGYWEPHDWHQNGLDVDVRYVRNDSNFAPYKYKGKPWGL